MTVRSVTEALVVRIASNISFGATLGAANLSITEVPTFIEASTYAHVMLDERRGGFCCRADNEARLRDL